MNKDDSVILPYGIDSALTLTDASVVGGLGTPCKEPIADIENAVLVALRQPIDFPPLSDSVFPGDTVAIVLEDEVPSLSRLVAAVVNELLTIGIEPDQICILRSEVMANHSSASPIVRLSEELRERIQVVTHDADDRNALGFIGPTKNNDPIYVNRQIADADVVIPIGVAKPVESLGNWGVHSSVISFSDSATQARFRKPKSLMVAKEVEKRLKEVQEIAWNVGTRMIVQVVPGSGEEILEVVSGDAASVQKHVDESCHQIWHFKAEQKASLVVATMTGGRQQQTWTALARVIQSALKLVQHEGAIAICSDLKMRPGAAVSKLMGSDSPEQADYLISKEGTPDAIAATMIARALEQTRVYLLSNYDEEFVEDLGIAFVSSADEVVRLASRQESCITLTNAQNAFIELSEESLTC